MREINVAQVTDAVKNLCINANYELSTDMQAALKNARLNEESELGKQILDKLDEKHYARYRSSSDSSESAD